MTVARTGQREAPVYFAASLHAPHGETLRRFVAMSAALTGYDDAELWGTGMVQTYLTFAVNAVGARVVGDLLSAWNDLAIAEGPNPPEHLMREMLLAPAEIGPVARNVVVMWYLGQWNQMPADWRDRHGANVADQNCVVSPDAYAQGLVWKAIGTHPQGAKMPGYGSWALPPSL